MIERMEFAYDDSQPDFSCCNCTMKTTLDGIYVLYDDVVELVGKIKDASANSDTALLELLKEEGF